jgi:hypothetical protein
MRKKLEKLRTKINGRVEMLHKHESEYRESNEKEQASMCDLKARQFILVLRDIDEILSNPN